MSTQLQFQKKNIPKPSSDSVRTGLLQRKCACSDSPGIDGECAECRAKRLSLQQSAAPSTASPTAVPPIVHEALSSVGQPLDTETRASIEPRFGHDFGNVRVHADSKAAESASAVDALAYTVGKDVVFGAGQYMPRTREGQRLLAHELTHVVQQEANPAVQGKTIHRQATKKTKSADKGDYKNYKYGQLHFAQDTFEDVLRQDSLLFEEDQAHIHLHDGRLGYDLNYTPVDPFRWNKLKDVIDSNEKIQVEKKSLGDQIPALVITGQERKEISPLLLNPGQTVITEALDKTIYPTYTGRRIVSREKDTLHIYYTNIGSAADNSLAHELFGHIWLALKKVPFVHPKDADEIKARGTLREEHKITDPLGNLYTGPVETFIADYVESKMFGGPASPTLHVSREMLQSALGNFKKDFAKNTTGKLNGKWHYNDIVEIQWKIIGNNYDLALKDTSRKDAITQVGIQQDLESWYKSIDVDQQYRFWKFLESVKGQMDIRGGLAARLLQTLTRPKGMHFSSDVP